MFLLIKLSQFLSRGFIRITFKRLLALLYLSLPKRILCSSSLVLKPYSKPSQFSIIKMPTTVLITGANRGKFPLVWLLYLYLYFNTYIYHGKGVYTKFKLIGIGRGLAEAFLSRPNHIVVAGVRNTETTSLKDFKTAEGSKLVLVEIKNTSTINTAAGLDKIKTEGITNLSIAVANAGINLLDALCKVEDISLAHIRNPFEVDTLLYVIFFQAVYLLLKATADKDRILPKLLAITSNAGQIIDMEPNIPAMVGSYGISKAALNYLVRCTDFENCWLASWVINPGFV